MTTLHPILGGGVVLLALAFALIVKYLLGILAAVEDGARRHADGWDAEADSLFGPDHTR
jgi:hypothetical protein